MHFFPPSRTGPTSTRYRREGSSFFVTRTPSRRNATQRRGLLTVRTRAQLQHAAFLFPVTPNPTWSNMQLRTRASFSNCWSVPWSKKLFWRKFAEKCMQIGNPFNARQYTCLSCIHTSSTSCAYHASPCFVRYLLYCLSLFEPFICTVHLLRPRFTCSTLKAQYSSLSRHLYSFFQSFDRLIFVLVFFSMQLIYSTWCQLISSSCSVAQVYVIVFPIRNCYTLFANFLFSYDTWCLLSNIHPSIHNFFLPGTTTISFFQPQWFSYHLISLLLLRF